MEQLVFGWTDYCLFTSLLGLSLLIGCYFGFCSKQDSVSEYLFGGRSMGYIPVSISILASFISGITFLGVPTETYLHGTQYIFTLLTSIANGFVTAYIFVPVFHKLQVASIFEYLELRFSRKARIFASILYIFSLLLYIPIVIYVPALAFSQVTGINLHIIAPVICTICITYTTMGGVKAVVWTDTIQFVFTMLGMITILIVGTKAAGGLSKIWKISLAGERVRADFNVSPFARDTFWTYTVGSFFSSISNSALGQKFMQRYLSIGSRKDINKAIFLKTIGTIFVDCSVVFTGLMMYTHYYGCDPISSNLVEREDKIVPFYVLEITKKLPGVSGIFLAGIVSSALSTMSASINTLSGIIYDDFIERWIPESPNKDSKAAIIMKVTSVIVGGVCIGLVFAVEHMGTVLEMSYNLRGAVDGPLLGVFLLGMMCPWVGNKGALTGGFVSVLVMSWIVIGSKWHVVNNTIRYSNLPLSVEKCSDALNVTLAENVTLPPLDPDQEPMMIFKLSFLYFILLGTMITVLVGLITSLSYQESDLSKIDPDHLTPIARRDHDKRYFSAHNAYRDDFTAEQQGVQCHMDSLGIKFLPKRKYEEVPIKEVLTEPISKKETTQLS